jgi:hypothetical protein
MLSFKPQDKVIYTGPKHNYFRYGSIYKVLHVSYDGSGMILSCYSVGVKTHLFKLYKR